MTEERLGFVGIVIEDRQSVPKVNVFDYGTRSVNKLISVLKDGL